MIDPNKTEDSPKKSNANNKALIFGGVAAGMIISGLLSKIKKFEMNVDTRDESTPDPEPITKVTPNQD